MPGWKKERYEVDELVALASKRIQEELILEKIHKRDIIRVATKISREYHLQERERKKFLSAVLNEWPTI